MAAHRALSRLFARWIHDGRLRYDCETTLNFALELGLIAEHTQGMDVKTHLQNWDKYTPEILAGQPSDSLLFPKAMQADCLLYRGGKKARLALTLLGKPAVRLPEAYWLSFHAADILNVMAEKLGEPVDVMDVVEGGNRQMHGIDRYVDVKTASHGTFRIWSDDAFLVNIGEACGLNYSTALPQLSGGLHFNLSNNLWGTNFSMWNEGSLTYHFMIERID